MQAFDILIGTRFSLGRNPKHIGGPSLKEPYSSQTGSNTYVNNSQTSLDTWRVNLRTYILFAFFRDFANQRELMKFEIRELETYISTCEIRRE